MPEFGPKSRAAMVGVHPDLVRVLERAIKLTDQDFSVLEGVRTQERQNELYAQGRTKPGKIVTWTLSSNHAKKHDGFGHAVDLVPYPLDWNSVSKFTAIAKAMITAGKELGVDLRWGGNWDMDSKPMERGENDIGHWELAP